MTDKGLVIIDPIESLIESQNNELKKQSENVGTI